MRSGRKSLLSSWIWLKWLKDFLAREKNKISAKFLGKGNQIIISFLLSLSLSILRRELLLIYPMIIKRSTSVQRHLWVLTSNPGPLGPWPWSQHPAGWPDQSWPQWCPPAIPYFHILSRLRGQNPFQPVWDNLGVSCFNFHKMQTKMDTDSQTVLSTGLDSLRFRINIFKFRQFHLPFFIRRKIWTYMRYVIDMYEYLIALCSWHQASMVNLASVKDGAFNDNGIPGLGGVMSSALTAIHSESNSEGSKQLSLLHIKT